MPAPIHDPRIDLTEPSKTSSAQRTACLLAILSGCAATSLAQVSATAIGTDYELVDLSARCAKPAIAPPRAPKESDWQFSVSRRLVDLDGSGQCVVMDFWTERVSKQPGSGMMITTGHMWRLHERKWETFYTPLKYFPFAVRVRRDNSLYLINLDTYFDHGADLGGEPSVFARPPAGTGWAVDLFALEYQLQPAPAVQGEVLQALAVLLAKRAGTVDKLNDADRERVRQAIEAAHRELAPQKRIALRDDGMPKL